MKTSQMLHGRTLMRTDDVTAESAADAKPLVSLVVPAFNEAAVVQKNLGVLCDYMQSLEHKYDWELLVVNDGSKDDTSALAKGFAPRPAQRARAGPRGQLRPGPGRSSSPSTSAGARSSSPSTWTSATRRTTSNG